MYSSTSHYASFNEKIYDYNISLYNKNKEPLLIITVHQKFLILA